MKKLVFLFAVMVSAVAYGQRQMNFPVAYKWLNDKEAVFTMRGDFNGDEDFSVDAVKFTKKEGVK